MKTIKLFCFLAAIMLLTSCQKFIDEFSHVKFPGTEEIRINYDVTDFIIKKESGETIVGKWGIQPDVSALKVGEGGDFLFTLSDVNDFGEIHGAIYVKCHFKKGITDAYNITTGTGTWNFTDKSGNSLHAASYGTLENTVKDAVGSLTYSTNPSDYGNEFIMNQIGRMKK